VIGGGRVMGIALLISTLLHVVTPILARLHYGYLMAVRAIQGLAMVRIVKHDKIRAPPPRGSERNH
jgi:hypothetical protein